MISKAIMLTLSLKRNKSLAKIILNLVTKLAVKKRRAILSLSPKLMALSVRSIKRERQKRQCSD